MSDIDDSEEQSAPAGGGTVKQVIRKGDGDIHLCITIVNNVGAAGAGLPTVVSEPANAPNPPRPLVGPDPDLPMPWSASFDDGAPSEGMAAPLLVKGFTPWTEAGNPKPHASIGDEIKIYRAYTSSASWEKAGIFVTKLHTPAILPPGSAAQGRGFAFGPTPATTSAVIVTDASLATSGSNYAGHAVDRGTKPAFRITNVVSTGAGTGIWNVTVEGDDTTKPAYLLAFPQRVGLASSSEVEYMKLAAVPENPLVFASGAPSATFPVKVERLQKGVAYYFFLCDAPPKAADQVPRVVSNVRKLVAT